MSTHRAESKPIILCVGSPGRAVVFGWVAQLPEPGEPVTLYDARMVLRFAARGLFGLASLGPSGDTRLTARVDWTTARVWSEALAVSPEAAAALAAWPVYGG